MQILFFLFILLSSINTFSQRVVDVSKNNSAATSGLFYAVGGEPMNNAKYVAIVEGSAFYNEAFLNGKIILSGGKVYDSLSLRLDLIDNTLHYIDRDGEELVATTPVKSVCFKDIISKTETQFDYADFIKTSSKIETGWYQLLDTGKVTLYKRYFKSIKENRPYGSATIEQTISTSNYYYVLINSVFTPLKKIKQLPEMLQDKKAELMNYINSKNLTGKSDKEYLELVTYYNSLVLKK
jgi:hypothetical protein